MADYEIDPIYGGMDPDEVKEWTLCDFMAAMMRSNAVAIIKFWSIISQVEDDKLRAAAKEWIGGISKRNRSQILEDIRQADADTGQHTDLTNCF